MNPEVVPHFVQTQSTGQVPPARARMSRWIAAAVVACLGVTAVVAVLAVRGGDKDISAAVPGPSVDASAGMPVNTIRPMQKTLVRTLEQPGSVRPRAQAELYAKASGYVRYIGREGSIRPAATCSALCCSLPAVFPSSCPAGDCAMLAFALRCAVAEAPQKDIGSRVFAGEVIMQLDVPEAAQDVAQKEALHMQAVAELRQARTNIGTFEANVQAADAQRKQAAADIRRYASEHAFQVQQLQRVEELLRDRIGTKEVVDEKKNLVGAAQAAWESSQAKAQAAQADYSVISSKLAAAQDDVLVKEARVRVALEDLRRAQVVADYASIRAPFDGVITYRAVDEGDFVQNSSSGQARHVMTVAAIDTVKVVLQVPERDAPFVRVGAPADVEMDARTGWKTHGVVSRTSESLDSQSRTMQVEIDLDNKDRKLLPGMYGQAVVTLQRIENAWAIPATALFSRRGENYVITVREGIARRQKVRIRYDDGRELEVAIVDGAGERPLNANDEIVVSNKGEIADGQRVHPTPLPAANGNQR